MLVNAYLNRSELLFYRWRFFGGGRVWGPKRFACQTELHTWMVCKLVTVEAVSKVDLAKFPCVWRDGFTDHWQAAEKS